MIKIYKNLSLIALGTGGLMMLVGGSIILVFLSTIVENKIKEELRLFNGSHIFESWRKTPIPLITKFYFFELNNSDTYTNLDDIELKESGPYVCEENRIKENIVFYSNDKKESLVSYQERHIFEFKEDLSVGHYDDNITSINGLIFNEILPESKLGYKLLEEYMEDENEKSLFTTRPVGQLLFDGISLSIDSILKGFIPKEKGLELRPFSVFETKNYLGKEMSVFTGIDRIDNFGQLYRFDYKSEIRNDDYEHSFVWPFHNDKNNSCNKLRGTDARFFKPYTSTSDILYMFQPHMCRSLFFKYLKPSEVRGIITRRYYIPKEVFESPLKYRQNSCYCLQNNITDCNRNGVYKLSHCNRVSKGGPLVFSAPYFLHGDNDLRDDINLVPPKPLVFENYGSFIDVEPVLSVSINTTFLSLFPILKMTGIVLKAFIRLQINIQISHTDLIPELNATKSGKDYIIPFLWLEESGEADQKRIDELNTKIFNKRIIAKGMSIGSIVLGVFLILIAKYYINFRSKNYSLNSSQVLYTTQ